MDKTIVKAINQKFKILIHFNTSKKKPRSLEDSGE